MEDTLKQKEIEENYFEGNMKMNDQYLRLVCLVVHTRY